jgi:hypothetical protein
MRPELLTNSDRYIFRPTEIEKAPTTSLVGDKSSALFIPHNNYFLLRLTISHASNGAIIGPLKSARGSENRLKNLIRVRI